MPATRLARILVAIAIAAAPQQAWSADLIMGKVYYLPEGTAQLPVLGNFDVQKVIGLEEINVPLRLQEQGFPGVGKRVEWFAVEFDTDFEVDKTGTYTFLLSSDDGAILYIDEEVVASYDGVHDMNPVEGSIELVKGKHRLRLPYFQGPRFQMGLELKWGLSGKQLDFFRLKPRKPPDFEIKELRPAEASAGNKADAGPPVRSKDNVLKFRVDGKNLKGVKVSCPLPGIDQGPAIEFRNVVTSRGMITGDMVVHGTAVDGPHELVFSRDGAVVKKFVAVRSRHTIKRH